MGIWIAADPVLGDEVHNTNTIVEGSLCVSDHAVCANPATYNFEADFKVEDERIRIQFEDSSLTEGIPTRDWTIRINDPADGGAEYFAIEDAGDGGSGSTQVFRLDAGAPANSLRIDDSGKIGIGTATPAQDLHIVSTTTGGRIRLERPDGGPFVLLRQWDIIGSDAFGIRDIASGNITNTFTIGAGAPPASLAIDSNGDVGVGTFGANAPLHVTRDDGTAKLLVEEASGTEASRTLLQLTNNGEAKFGFNNTAFARQWEFFASVGFSINEITNPGLEFVFTPTGNLNMTGTLTTGGPTCSGGCDELFQPGGELESIEDHAASMWENSHLPAVGPTQPGQPMNLSEKMGGLINELEKAHIYIERLHEQLKEERRRNDSLEARLARLESLLPIGAGD